MAWYQFWKKKPTANTPAVIPGFTENFDQRTFANNTNWLISDWGAPGGGVFSPAKVDLASGMLRITMTQAGGNSVGGEIQSYQKFSYGTYEWTARMSSTANTPLAPGIAVSGSVSGLFNFYNDSQTEIDFEALGDRPTRLYLTNWNLPQAQGVRQQASDVPMLAGSMLFNRYKYVWRAGRIDFYVNDILVKTHTLNVPTAPAQVLINHWGTNDPWWGGIFTPGTRYLYVSKFTYTP